MFDNFLRGMFDNDLLLMAAMEEEINGRIKDKELYQRKQDMKQKEEADKAWKEFKALFN